MSLNYANRLSFILIALFTLTLALYGSTLGVSFDEAQTFYSGQGVASYLMQTSVSLFGQNDLALRIPFILIHSISAVIFYKISLEVLKRPLDAIISLGIFLLLPGLNMVGLLANKAALLLALGLLSALFLLKNRLFSAFILMTIGAFSDNGFAAFLIGVSAWAFSDRKYKFGVGVGILFLICMTKFGFNDGGLPQGWFLETIGSYFALFSPIVFIFYIYALFKLRKNPTILWQITFWSIALSLVLSLRQRIALVDYAPYSAFAIPLAVGFFTKEWRTKLPEFRLKYKIGGIITALTLILWSSSSFFLQNSLFAFTSPMRSPIWPHLIAKELAIGLKNQNFNAVNANDKELQLRLKWYGVDYNQNVVLNKENGDVVIPICYSGKTVANYYIDKTK